MASRSGGGKIYFNKVRIGGDQAFTLPKGTSAAPIMNVKPTPYVKKVKNVVVDNKVYKGTGNKKIKVTMYPPLKGPAGQVTRASGGKKPNLSQTEKSWYKPSNNKGYIR